MTRNTESTMTREPVTVTSDKRTITVPASHYEDHDDCLDAARCAYLEAHHEVEWWQVTVRWADDERTDIELTVPATPIPEMKGSLAAALHDPESDLRRRPL